MPTAVIVDAARTPPGRRTGNGRAAARRAGGNVGATRVPNLSGFWFTIDGDGRLRDPVSVGTLPDEDLHGDIE
ncbi:MAG: hypothetical protein ACKOOG_14075 [Actinomycetota bacterium]